jgi:CubicO group peptidase (beta-lactamase class C family)
MRFSRPAPNRPTRIERGAASRALVALLSAAALGACGGSSTGPDGGVGGDPPAVASVEITPAAPSVFEDGALQMTARPRAADGATLSGRAVAWSSSDPGVASITNAGAVSARDPGTTTLTATSEGRSATVTLTVLRSRTAEVRLSVADVLVGTGDRAAITAEAIDSAGRVLRNRTFVWSTDAPAVATAAAGEITGVTEGTTVLRVDVEGVEGTADVDVFTVRGMQVSELASVDAAMVAYMREYGIPGGVVAVAREGRLVHARGYGVADLLTGVAIEPDQIMRWGSVSKPIAGLAAAMLIEDGTIARDDLPFQAMPGLTPLPGETPDARIAGITLQNLLDHAGGWDNNRAVDSRLWIDGTNRDAVRDQTQLIRYGLGVPLDHEPGATYAYSNYATQVVAEYIAAVTGVEFETWVQENIFAPLGATLPRFGTGDPAQEPEQPIYHDRNGAAVRVPVLDQNYAGASGAWIGRSMDLMRLVNAIEGVNGPALLQESTRTEWSGRPAATWGNSGYYYTNFMEFLPGSSGLAWYHTGLPRGGLARFWRRPDGTTWIVILNRSPDGPYPDLNAGIDAVGSWPSHDLFGGFD